MNSITSSSINSTETPPSASLGNPPKHGITITVHNLSKSFEGTPTLRQVSFQVNPGEIFVIMGPSGSGKTVLLRHIIGLLTPDEGEVKVDGESPLSETFRDRIRMALVFQNGGLLNSLSVEENVGLYLTEHRLKSDEEIKKIVTAELEKLNLSRSDALKFPYELSGGMIKRVAIARAIVMEPKVVLYDEPTSELDPVAALSVIEEIRRIHEQQHQTTILVTHDRELAYAIADRIAILIDGRILKIGTPKEIQALSTSTNENEALLKKFLNTNFKYKKQSYE